MAIVGVLLIEQNRLLREGFKQILPRDRFAIRAEINTIGDVCPVLEKCNDASLELAICSLSDSSAGEFETIKRIAQRYPQLHWIVLAPKRDARLLKLAIHSGISGVLSKDISPEALCNCLELILLGEHIFPSSSVFFDDEATISQPELGDSDRKRQDAAVVDTVALSENQRTALAYVMKGASNKVIAREMGIAEATVKVHLKALMKKLNANNRTQVAVLGLRGLGLPGHESSLDVPTAMEPGAVAHRV